MLFLARKSPSIDGHEWKLAFEEEEHDGKDDSVGIMMLDKESHFEYKQICEIYGNL